MRGRRIKLTRVKKYVKIAVYEKREEENGADTT